MRINGTATVMNSALQTILNGERTMMKAASEAASGGSDNLAQTLVTLNCAKQTQSIGVSLARIDDETTGFLIDTLA
jgi:hypothetical protein